MKRSTSGRSRRSTRSTTASRTFASTSKAGAAQGRRHVRRRSCAESDDLLQSLAAGRRRGTDVPRLTASRSSGRSTPTGSARRRAASGSSSATRRRDAEEAPCAKQILATPRAQRVPPPGRRPDDLEPLLAFYAQGRAGRRLRRRHPEGRYGDPGEPEVPVSRASRRRRAGAQPGATYPHQRSRARVAAVVLPVERVPDEELLELARSEQAARARGARRAGAPHARRSARRALVTNFAFQWLNVRTARRASIPDPTSSRTFDATCATRFARRWSCSSTASCATTAASRSADARHTFVNERLALPLRHSGRARRAVPARAR